MITHEVLEERIKIICDLCGVAEFEDICELSEKLVKEEHDRRRSAELKSLERWVLGRGVTVEELTAITVYLENHPEASILDAYFIMLKDGIGIHGRS